MDGHPTRVCNICNDIDFAVLVALAGADLCWDQL